MQLLQERGRGALHPVMRSESRTKFLESECRPVATRRLCLFDVSEPSQRGEDPMHGALLHAEPQRDGGESHWLVLERQELEHRKRAPRLPPLPALRFHSWAMRRVSSL